METTGNKIRVARQITKERRVSMVCQTFEVKIQYSSLSKKEKEQLKMYFVEAKWIYNNLLSKSKKENIFEMSYKDNNSVTVLDKDGNKIKKKIQFLPTAIHQDIYTIAKTSIKALSASKKKGRKVGNLKFKSSYNTLELRNQAWRIVGKNKIKIAGFKKPLKVRGLDQINPNMETANAKLMKKSTGYYLIITTYSYIKGEIKSENKKQAVGLDFGIKTHITTSEGEQFNLSIGETKRLKYLQRKLYRRSKKGSNNRWKLRLKIQKEYDYIANKKKDAANKLLHYLLSNYNYICVQDENLQGWHKGLFGKQVQHSYLGLLKRKLKEKKLRVLWLEQRFPSTKMCYNCGEIHREITLADRIFKCDCGLEEDRDVKAAKTILKELLIRNQLIPAERREFKPVEKMSDFLNSSEFKKHFSRKQEAPPFR